MPLIERPHWSYSAINQYLRCPLQFYFERIRQLPVETVGSGLVLGSAVHRGLEAYHRSLQDGRPVPADHVKNIFQATWQFREQQQEIQYRSGENRQKAIDQGIALLETYLREPPPENIVAVEQSIIVPLRNSRGEYTETPLVAVIDLLTDHEEGLKVTVLKTSARA